MLSFVSLLTVLIEDQNQTCQVFDMNSLKLEEFKQGDLANLLFSKIFLPFNILDGTHYRYVVIWWVVSLFSASYRTWVIFILKLPISKFLFSYLVLCITQWTSAKEKFDLDKMQSFLEVWKRSNLPPFWSTIHTSLPMVWNELWRRLRHTWLQAWLKTSEISQAWSHNSEHVDLVISSTGWPQENKIFRFLKIHKKLLVIQIEIFYSLKFIAWNTGSDGKIKILTVWAL